MYNFRPAIFCSRCLGFEKCRYNGEVINSPYVDKLSKFCDMITVCPEVEIGLGVPRKPIRIIKTKDSLRLVQSETLLDLTRKMETFSENYLQSLPPVQGFILKYKSPSCGLSAAKYHSSMEKGSPLGTGPGFFGKALLEKYPDYPAETETRLSNFIVREHFLLRIFTFADFQETKKKKTSYGLVEFHSRTKLLLMAYSQIRMRQLGGIVANIKSAGLNNAFEEYGKILYEAFKKNASHNSHINVIQHAAGYFSNRLKKSERDYMNELLLHYRDRKIPLSALRTLINSYIIRFDIKYLAEQTYFNPYPIELSEIGDSGKGRDLKHF